MVANFIQPMVNAACQFLQSDPCAITPLPNVCRLSTVGVALQGIQQIMCPPPAPPPVPPRPYAPAGQCAGRTYFARMRYQVLAVGATSGTSALQRDVGIGSAQDPFFPTIAVSGVRQSTQGANPTWEIIVSTGGRALNPATGQTIIAAIENRNNFQRPFNIEIYNLTQVGNITPCTPIVPDIGFPDFADPNRPPAPIVQVSLTANIPITPTLNFSLPFTLEINRPQLTFDFKIDNQLVFNFNAGGINLNLGLGGGTGGGGIPQTVIDEINNIGDTVNVTNDTVNNINERLENSVDCCDTIEEILRRIGQPSSIPLAPDEECGNWGATVPLTLFEGLGMLGEIAETIDGRRCDEGEGLTEQLLLSSEATIAQSSFYVDVPDNCVAVRVVLVGELPSRQTFRQSNEASGKFGAIAQCRSGSTSEQLLIWTRFTVMRFDADLYNQVRLFLNPGIEFSLYALIKD